VFTAGVAASETTAGEQQEDDRDSDQLHRETEVADEAQYCLDARLPVESGIMERPARHCTERLKVGIVGARRVPKYLDASEVSSRATLGGRLDVSCSQYKAMLQCQKHWRMSNRSDEHHPAIGRPGMPSQVYHYFRSDRSSPTQALTPQVLNVPLGM